jgi:hypothetical protein
MSPNGGGETRGWEDAGNHTEPLKYFRRNAAFELAGVKVTACVFGEHRFNCLLVDAGGTDEPLPGCRNHS